MQITGHRKSEIVCSRRQRFRAQVEDVTARAAERRVKAKIVVRVRIAGIYDGPRSRRGSLDNACGVDNDIWRSEPLAS